MTNSINNRFKVMPTHDGNWEVTMQNHKGGRKAHHCRRLCLCTHEDDAKNIAIAMEAGEREEARSEYTEYWSKHNG